MDDVKLEIDIHWMVRRDMPSVLAIEEASFEFPWNEEDFIRQLRRSNCAALVAECDDEVVGYMLYELHSSRLHLVALAVNPAFRRRSIGTTMLRKLAGKLSQDRRNRITLAVRETNLNAQLFFRSLGFRAIAIVNDYYEDSTEPAYFMQYR